jgi:hypothetical protein
MTLSPDVSSRSIRDPERRIGVLLLLGMGFLIVGSMLPFQQYGQRVSYPLTSFTNYPLDARASQFVYELGLITLVGAVAIGFNLSKPPRDLWMLAVAVLGGHAFFHIAAVATGFAIGGLGSFRYGVTFVAMSDFFLSAAGVQAFIGYRRVRRSLVPPMPTFLR